MAGFEVIGAEELEEINDVFARGGVLFRHGFEALRGDCYKVRDFEQEFASFMGVDHALAVTSGTAALRVALAACGIGPGDEVITQSFTFVATVEGIIEAGALPVCTEIDDSMNMDADDLLAKITPATKAVIVVHMLGTPANMPRIKEICDEHGLILIEDTAWGCGGSLNGKKLGTIGDIGTFSFDFAKTMTTGEGGMITFQSEDIYAKAAAWHDHGHENNPAVPRWEDTRAGSGFNYRMMELQGAVGLAQLKKLPQVIEAQRANRDLIAAAIAHFAGITPRHIPSGGYDTADAYVFTVADNATALACRHHLVEAGLGTKILPEAHSWHFAGSWSHMPTLVERAGGDLMGAYPKSLALINRAVSLPIVVKMASDVPERIAQALALAFKG